MASRFNRAVKGFSVIATGLAALLPCAAMALPLDLNTFTAENYPAANTFSTPNWVVFDDGYAVTETGNSYGTVLYSPQTVLNRRIRGVILPGADDDIVGVALGFNPGDTSNSNANFLVIDWKGVTQTFNYTGGIHDLTAGQSSPVGLALSQIQGVPTNDELFGHEDLIENPGGGVVELARGNTRGATSYNASAAVRNGHEFEIIYQPGRVQVWVNGDLEFDQMGDFSDGRLGLYELSQSPSGGFGQWNISAIEDTSDTFQRYTAGLIEVTPGTTDATSTWTVTATGEGAHHMSVISGPNHGDAEIAFDSRVPRANEGVMLLSVAENGPGPLGHATATSSHTHAGWGQQRFGISTFRTTAQNAEGNINVAAGFFPFENWTAAHVFVPSGTGFNNHSIVASSGGITAGDITQINTPSVTDQNGVYNLNIPGVNSATDGLFFVVSAQNGNDGNYTAATPNGQGGWRIGLRDNFNPVNTSPDTFEHDSFSFVYMPIDTPHLIGAHVTGFNPDGSAITDISTGGFHLVRQNTGEYLLTIDGVLAETGMLALVASSPHTMPNGELVPLNQYMTYETMGGSFAINQLRLEGGATLEDGGFYFAFLPFVAAVPEPATGLLALTGLAFLARRRNRRDRVA